MTRTDGSHRTPLRAAYERVRALPLVQQMRECIDLLENPSVLASDLAEAYVLMETCGEPEEPAEPAASEDETDEEEAELSLEHFTPGREIVVVSAEPDVGDAVFTCVTGCLHPTALPEPGAPLPEGGLDYTGLQREAGPTGSVPILGAVESLSDPTPYALLLRLLACLTEMAPEAQARRLDRTVFKGGLGDRPIYDLHLVLWEPAAQSEGDGRLVLEHDTLFQLTRDLAEAAKAACFETPQLAASLGSVQCLRMDPGDFQGRLSLEWEL